MLVEERLFRSREILQVALERCDVRFALGRLKAWDRHRGEDADDDDHDQQLDEGESRFATRASHRREGKASDDRKGVAVMHHTGQCEGRHPEYGYFPGKKPKGSNACKFKWKT